MPRTRIDIPQATPAKLLETDFTIPDMPRLPLAKYVVHPAKPAHMLKPVAPAIYVHKPHSIADDILPANNGLIFS